jgi:hypothetical protein
LDRIPPRGTAHLEHKGQILEKVEEVLWFTVMHVRTERGAYRNLTEINVFGPSLSFDSFSTSIVETL